LRQSNAKIAMKKIGITGGVGAGKTQVINHLRLRDDSVVCVADIMAAVLCMPGFTCYDQIVEILGKDVLNKAGEIDRKKMSSIIFANPQTRTSVNAVIHPAVKSRFLEIAHEASHIGKSYIFLEAALLLEDGYRKILDEIWYIHADVFIRKQRLANERGYSNDRIIAIMDSQKSEEYFRSRCDWTVENNGDIDTLLQCIDEKLNND